MAIEKLSVILELVSGNYKKEAREAAIATGKIGDSAKAASGALRGLTTGALVAAGAGIIKFGADSVKAASNLEESMNAVNVVFGSAAKIITDFGESAATSAGLAQAEFQQMASVLGSALINAGIPLDEAAEKTIELTQRAADMASVFNTSVPEALGAMQAALRGESDPIEKFGVTLSSAAVDAEAAALGFKKVAGQFDAQAKAAARLSLIMKQTDRVAGDFANTSDGLANSSKVLTANMTNLQAQVGGFITPALAELSAEGIEAVEGLSAFVGVIEKALAALPGMTESTEDASLSVDKYTGLLDILIPGLAGTTQQWKELNDQLERNAISSIKAIDKGEELIEVHDSWTLASANFNPIFGETVELIDRGAVAFSNAARAADTARKAVVNLANAQADILDPLANVLRLQTESREAQERLIEVQDDEKATLEELAIAVIEAEQAELRLASAGAALTPEQVQAFAQTLIIDLGMSEAQALETLQALNLLNGWTGSARFTLEMNTVASGGGGAGNINTDILGFSEGGVVPGALGSAQLIIAHGGETIIPIGGSVSGSTQTSSKMQVFNFAAPVKPVDLQWLSLMSNLETLVS